MININKIFIQKYIEFETNFVNYEEVYLCHKTSYKINIKLRIHLLTYQIFSVICRFPYSIALYITILVQLLNKMSEKEKIYLNNYLLVCAKRWGNNLLIGIL